MYNIWYSQARNEKHKDISLLSAIRRLSGSTACGAHGEETTEEGLDVSGSNIGEAMGALLVVLPADLIRQIQTHLTKPRILLILSGQSGWLIHLFLGPDDSGFWIVPGPEQLLSLCRATACRNKSARKKRGRREQRNQRQQKRGSLCDLA